MAVDELGHPSSHSLRDNVDVPEPGEGQVRITVEAGNINFADILFAKASIRAGAAHARA